MVKIKNWKIARSSKHLIIYRNTLPEYRLFANAVYLGITPIGLTNEWSIQFVKKGKGFFKKIKTKTQALTYARNYMKAHPRG